jgi:hypothetical protein
MSEVNLPFPSFLSRASATRPFIYQLIIKRCSKMAALSEGESD